MSRRPPPPPPQVLHVKKPFAPPRKAEAQEAQTPAYSRGEMKRLLEAVLFAADKPVPASMLAHILSNSSETEVRDALIEMAREYEELGRSFVLKEIGGGYLLSTHPAYEPWVRKLFRGRLTLRLSKSALETIAIVAYRQPVSKQDIEIIRGVNADGVLNTLLDRKLIRVVGRKEGMGRALIYGTSDEFLVYMGLNDLTELPQIEEMKAILETQEPPAEATDGVSESSVPGDVPQGPFIGPSESTTAPAPSADVPAETPAANVSGSDEADDDETADDEDDEEEETESS